MHSTTLLSINCLHYHFHERRSGHIRGLLNVGARVDFVSSLGETPLEAFHRSALVADAERVPGEVEGIVHTMLHAEGHSSGVFHDGVNRVLASPRLHPGFETLRNYEVVEAFAVHTHALPMELCRMVACAMGVPP